MNIFNIGKANERIAALEKEAETLKAEKESAVKAASENTAQIESAAEALKIERDSLSAKLDAETKAHAATKLSLSEKESALKTAQSEVSELPAKIESAAATRAQQIMASLGQPPVKEGKPAATAGGQADTSNLTGIARTRAAFQAQFDKNQPK